MRGETGGPRRCTWCWHGNEGLLEKVVDQCENRVGLISVWILDPVPCVVYPPVGRGD